MKLSRLRLSNFRCFGAEPTEISFDDTTFILGPNGSGKTSVLQALARMFSLDPAQRRIRPSDFHVPSDEDPTSAPSSRKLWLEADFEFPELTKIIPRGLTLPAVASSFSHLQMERDDESVLVRFRLDASIDVDGDIEENFSNVARVSEHGSPELLCRVSKQDRNAVQVHYLPARRNPAEHISYSASALLGRTLRSANWVTEREKISVLTRQIADALISNASVQEIGEELEKYWHSLHTGKYYVYPSISFAKSEIENLLRHLSLGFAPGHDTNIVDFSRLSDGQQSLLYMTLVLALHKIGEKVLAAEIHSFDVDKLRPPVFTMIAVEEPENSLSPHYLGRVIRVLREFAKAGSAQVVVATHAPALLSRVDPEMVRYLRLDEKRRTSVKRIEMPVEGDINKYVREGIQAFPELYFARFVVLGEGDSEEIVLPRLLASSGVLVDDASVSVVPLGGRHVNHFWRLLNGLGIPFVTLLDLDLARHQGGWGRVRYAATQLLKYRADVDNIDPEDIKKIPDWDDYRGIMMDDHGWIGTLEANGVFFSSPLDLDFMMMEAYRDAYSVESSEFEDPNEKTLSSVLGKSHDTVEDQYSREQQKLFGAYQRRFKVGSKPSWHIDALSKMDDRRLLKDMPAPLLRMFKVIESKIGELSE